MSDTVLKMSDDVERTIEAAQASFLNGDPYSAQIQLRNAITMIDAIADEERRRAR